MRRSDTAVGKGKERLGLFLAVLVASAAVPAVAAQDGLSVSASADYSTHDRLFSEADVIHIKVVPGARLDLTAVIESRVEIVPAGDGETYEGVLDIMEDGSFVARAAVAELEGPNAIWHLRVAIEDAFGTEYRARTALVIRDLAGVPETFRVDGFIEAASEASITVSGHEFAVISATEVHADGGVSELIGRRVLVVAERAADGRATALQIFGQREGGVRFVGEITAVGASSITVDATTVSVNRQTTVKTWFGGTTSLDGLEVGTYVLVAAQRTSDGWVAVAVVTRRGDVSGADDEVDPHEIEGRVEAVTDASITVGGMTFTVAADAEIEGAAGPAYIEVGAFVEIEFVAGEPGELIALRIEVDDEDNNGDGRREGEIEAEGAITAISDHSLTVEGVEFIVTGSAEIDGDAENLEYLYTGLYAEAEGRLASDGTVRATRIEIEHDGDRDQLFLRGEITSIEGSAVTVGKTTFVVTDSTPIRGGGGGSLALRDVEAGMIAHAHLAGSVGGELAAVGLKVERRFDPDAITLAGRIDEVSASAITVHDLIFQITGATEIEDFRGETVATDDLRAGQVARISGVRTGDGYVAHEVRMRMRIHHEGGFGGVVTAVSDGSISVNGAAFAVGGETIVEGVASPDAIALGDRVRSRYRILGDGSRLAIRIGVHANVDVNTELSGVIDDVASGVVQVAGVSVYLTLATRVHDERGRPIGSSALEAGQMIDVKGTSTADGVVAAMVDVETAVAVSGPAVIGSEGRLVIAGDEYELDDQTLIVGRSNAELTSDVLDAGAYVDMIAVDRGSDDTDGDGAMYAQRVLVMQTMEGTASETDEPGVATTFVLEQNYPNPFNPTTTIRFEVGMPGDRDVSLTVFDVLGRHVRTLVDASLSPGAYSYAWTGLDGAGRPVASGIYLYRLQVGDGTATRSMALLK